ncbi:hypothetical protein MYCTH_2133403 [Thermothelomyces thermophilus ATCC 42464]|uniref:Uncharacterized protein n=1 Tax=Thermothelomyces thermophilus (strain ATCC 42464 / BCRC 31852 / DSM 1799) TaxID=573729 RepID=G2Q9V6_THET4|nr:uncharacterized protein MYCTH_2133403 [Thermothelomyces thermophilus ATCC 42464]AEO56565.1 hypothetical protein MYCTH_2133403 [Thermothelomyces thermophilus ATCC 42464]
MDHTADVHAIPMPSIPLHVYVVSALLVCSLLRSQLLGMWLTGFKKPLCAINAHPFVLWYVEPWVLIRSSICFQSLAVFGSLESSTSSRRHIHWVELGSV